ncbi:MAG TPA: hypothetical protein VFS58_03430 [Steroidobacteraceae bacterium]|nr:hypothetical protein [Steroidobacteraceae bacterium]
MRKSVLFFATLCIITAAALAATNRDTEVLLQAKRLQLEFRLGNHEAAKPLVKTLEDAVAQSGDNAELWEAMGHAYMSMQGSMFKVPLDIPALLAVGERAHAAYARSLAIDADNPLARASLGMSLMVVSQLKGDVPGMMAGVEEMNAAARQAPKSTGVRLTRGFTMIHLPPDMRDTNTVIQDLQFIVDAAPGGRPEDVLHVLLGDVYAEVGNVQAARKEYGQVTGASAFAAGQAKLRLADLQKGTIPPASIALVRAGTGTNCAMCHTPGTDN